MLGRMTPQRLAVWGDPIAHSKSPQLHAAAYAALGLDWEYTRRRVDEVAFSDTLGALDDSWRGLSLTMPLKEKAHRAARTHDRYADLTGAVNTLLLTDGISGFNTDVGGIVDALGEQGLLDIESVRILGAGATASSALVACVEAGARSIDVRARRPERAAELVALGQQLGVAISASPFDADALDVGLTVATLPGGAELDDSTSARLSASGECCSMSPIRRGRRRSHPCGVTAAPSPARGCCCARPCARSGSSCTVTRAFRCRPKRLWPPR